MTIAYHSAPAMPRDRGFGFGTTHSQEIKRNLDFYERLYAAVGGLTRDDIGTLGGQSLDAINAWAPELAEEIDGIAVGASVPLELVAALNARTEILAQCRTAARECSTAVALGPEGADPAAVQTWDWHDDIERGWLIWTIEHIKGRRVCTLTEYGIVGKIGLSSVGIGVLLNILRHADDGTRIGTPVHIITRRILDEAATINDALHLIGNAKPSASSAITLIAVQDGEKTALTAEVWPGGPSYILPNERGVLVHTNHFVDTTAAAGDQEPTLGPDSFFRYEILRRRLGQLDNPNSNEIINAMTSHLGGAGGLCCHPDPDAALGNRYATLATVTLDPANRRLLARVGGPCATHPALVEANADETVIPSH